jgi:hypothetical protein
VAVGTLGDKLRMFNDKQHLRALHDRRSQYSGRRL